MLHALPDLASSRVRVLENLHVRGRGQLERSSQAVASCSSLLVYACADNTYTCFWPSQEELAKMSEEKRFELPVMDVQPNWNELFRYVPCKGVCCVHN